MAGEVQRICAFILERLVEDASSRPRWQSELDRRVTLLHSTGFARCPDDTERPCPTLRGLASRWADHPEYEPEWTGHQ